MTNILESIFNIIRAREKLYRVLNEIAQAEGFDLTDHIAGVSVNTSKGELKILITSKEAKERRYMKYLEDDFMGYTIADLQEVNDEGRLTATTIKKEDFNA